MKKLYSSALHRNHWIAHIPGSGWLIFPTKQNGWEDRKPARGLDPMHLREVPARMAAETGFPEAAGKPELVSAA
jgi:hypothetical protein